MNVWQVGGNRHHILVGGLGLGLKGGVGGIGTRITLTKMVVLKGGVGGIGTGIT